MTKIKITDISIGKIENNKNKKVKAASKIKLVAPLKEIPSKYWDKVKVGNDWDREYVEAENDLSWGWEGSRSVPMTPSEGSGSLSKVINRRFKTQELLDNYKKYVDTNKKIKHRHDTIKGKMVIRYFPPLTIGEFKADTWFSTCLPTQLTQFLRDANKLFVKDGLGKTTSKEAFEFLQSIIESKEIKSQVKFIPGDEITLGEWLKYRDNSNKEDQIELTEQEATELGVNIGSANPQPSPSQPVVTQPTLPIPADYQQTKDELTKWTNTFGEEKPEEIKKQVELLPLVQTELNNSKQKYNDSQAELNNTKNALSTEQANNHLLTLQVTNLNDDLKHKDDRITDLEKRPNISNEDWIKDYSQRPTQAELDKVKDERDQRPNISSEDYQKLVGIKNELDKWTKVFPDGDAQEIKVQIDQLKSDVNDWTSVFSNENPTQVNDRINYLKNNQEKHTANDLKPVDLPSNWKEQLNRLPSLEQRPNISITETQWNNDYSQRPTLDEFNRVKNELVVLNNLKLNFDNLKKKILKYKTDVINKNWTNLTGRLGVAWSEVDHLYKSYGKDLDNLINGNLTLTNLENDKLFEMAEETIKRVIFSVASQKTEQKSEEAKKDSDLTRGKVSELIKWFDKLIDVSITELKEVNMIDNPFYLEEIEKKLNITKSNNSNQISFWKKRIEWDKTARLLLQAEEVAESLIEYPSKNN